jgi:hypothetical protein
MTKSKDLVLEIAPTIKKAELYLNQWREGSPKRRFVIESRHPLPGYKIVLIGGN